MLPAPEAAVWRLGRWSTAGLLTVLSGLMALAAPEWAHAAKTITLSAASTSIAEGDSGTKEVTITVTLGEPAPAGGLQIYESYDPSGSTALLAGYGQESCTTAVDACYPAVEYHDVAAGATMTSFVLGIVGDTEEESDETILVTAKTQPESDWTSGTLTITITDDDGPPDQPTGLSARAGQGQVTLSWDDPGDSSISHYEYEQSTEQSGLAGTSFNRMAGSGASTTSYTVTGLAPRSEGYWFTIRAVNGFGVSASADPSLSEAVSGGGGSGGDGDSDDGDGSGGDGDSDDGDGSGDGGDSDDGDDSGDGDSDDSGPPMASFTLDALCADGLCRAKTGMSVSFRDTSTGTVSSRAWSFGDGKASSGSAPRHAWSVPGFYTVSLTVRGGGSSDTESRKVLVEAADPAGTCSADSDTRCLRDSRFSVAVDWWAKDGEPRQAAKVVHEGTDDSALFRFFSAGNWEVLLKVLDGCSVNGNVWVFGASATTLGYSIKVTDTVTGTMKEYRNEPGTLSAAITDNSAFPGACSGAGAAASLAPSAVGDAASASRQAAAASAAMAPVAAAEGDACKEDASTLCLLGDRYAVSVDWTSVDGAMGKGRAARPRTDDSGLFWFFSSTNWELLVKVLNGCSTNERHWVFAASATDVGFVLTVRDTLTGQMKRYTHAAGTPALALADLSAFPEVCGS